MELGGNDPDSIPCPFPEVDDASGSRPNGVFLYNIKRFRPEREIRAVLIGVCSSTVLFIL